MPKKATEPAKSDEHIAAFLSDLERMGREFLTCRDARGLGLPSKQKHCLVCILGAVVVKLEWVPCLPPEPKEEKE